MAKTPLILLEHLPCHLVHFAPDKLERVPLRRVHCALLHVPVSTRVLARTLCRLGWLELGILTCIPLSSFDFDQRPLNNPNLFRREIPALQLWSLIVRDGLLIHVEGDIGMKRAEVAPTVLRLHVLADVLARWRIRGDEILYINGSTLRPSPVTWHRDGSVWVL